MADATLLSNNEPTLEAAEADLDRLLAEEISIQTELDQLEEKAARLDTRRKDVGSERHKLKRIIGKRLCRNFIDKFYATLPPELREMVYDYVWDESMLRLVFDDVTRYKETSSTIGHPLSLSSIELYLYHLSRRDHPREDYPQQNPTKIAPWSVRCTQDMCGCFKWWELPFWVQHQYVGMDVAVEVAKAYYRKMSPPRLDPGHLEDFPRLLSRDHFHLGINPLDHIRRVEIPLLQEANIQDEWQITHLLQSKKGLDIFQRYLEKLLEVRVLEGFQLTIKLTWNGSLIYCMPALERSRGVINTLLGKGAKVTVLAWDKQQHREYDVSDYYVLTSEDWQGKWVRKLRKDHRRLVSSSSFIFARYSLFDPSLQDFTVLEDTVEVLDPEQEEWENEKDEAFLKTLTGQEGPGTEDIHGPLSPSVDGFDDEDPDLTASYNVAYPYDDGEDD